MFSAQYLGLFTSNKPRGNRNFMVIRKAITLYCNVWPGNLFLVFEAIQFRSDQLQEQKAV